VKVKAIKIYIYYLNYEGAVTSDWKREKYDHKIKQKNARKNKGSIGDQSPSQITINLFTVRFPEAGATQTMNANQMAELNNRFQHFQIQPMGHLIVFSAGL